MVLGVVDTMQVETEISEADVPSVSPGMSAYFTILGNADRRFEATLISIDPAPESITSDPAITSSSSSSSSSSSTAIYYRGWLQVDNADQALRTYMTAEVHIILGEAKGVLTIPSAALGSRNADGGYEVRVLGRDGTVETRTITIGLDNKITVEVRDGLSEGERVITGQAAAAQTSSGGSSGRPPGPMGF